MGDAEVIPIEGARSRGPERPSGVKIRCRATTVTGRPCRNYAVDDAGYCKIHSSDSSARRRHPSGAVASEASGTRGQEPEGSFLDFVRRRLAGDYPIDDFGYDPELSREVLLKLARPLYDNYFRVKALGVDRIPNDGPALLVANHSGTVPLDAVMMQYAVASEHPQKRMVRNVAASLAFRTPFIGPLARKSGNAVACEEDAHELLRRGELVGVFPEGYKGVGKGWNQRYRLQRFGRGGFIEIALKAGVPIIPVAIVGAEEAYPMIGNARFLAKALGFPYFPVTPTFPLLGPLGLLPLPSRWIIEFGEPIPMDQYPQDAYDDAMLVFDLSDEIRDRIQQMLYRVLNMRKGTFF